MSDEPSLDNIEWLKDMQRLRLGPGDVLVMRISAKVSVAEQMRTRHLVSEIFPNNEFLFLSDVVEIGIIEAGV